MVRVCGEPRGRFGVLLVSFGEDDDGRSVAVSVDVRAGAPHDVLERDRIGETPPGRDRRDEENRRDTSAAHRLSLLPPAPRYADDFPCSIPSQARSCAPFSEQTA